MIYAILCQNVIMGDVETLRRLLADAARPLTSNDDTRATLAQMCHPLCDCVACQRLVASMRRHRVDVVELVNGRNQAGYTGGHSASFFVLN